VTVFHLDETRLDGSHRLERTSLKVKEVRTICRSALSEDADRVKPPTSIFDFNLASHYCLNDLVPFFLSATPVDEDALEALAEHTQNRYFLKLNFGREAWVQGAQNQVKDLLKADVVAYNRWDICSFRSLVNRWKLAMHLLLLRRNIIWVLTASKPRRIRLREKLLVVVSLATDRDKVCPFLLPDQKAAVLVIARVKLLHQATDWRCYRLQLVAAEILWVVNLSFTQVPVGVPSGEHEDSDKATANVVRAIDKKLPNAKIRAPVVMADQEDLQQ
jgi:hypothetical protein